MTDKTDVKCCCAYGGCDSDLQIKMKQQIRKGCDILIGCPGKLRDYYEHGMYSLSACKACVLDEADKMLDMGFE